MIYVSIFRPKILYGSEGWVDSGDSMNDLEVAGITISGVSRRDQWENRISNDNVRDGLNVVSLDEVARMSRLRWTGHVLRMKTVVGSVKNDLKGA